MFHTIERGIIVLENNLAPSKQILSLLQSALTDLATHNERFSLLNSNSPFASLCIKMATAEFLGKQISVPEELSAQENQRSLDTLHAKYSKPLAQYGLELSYSTVDPYVGNPEEQDYEREVILTDRPLRAEGSEVHLAILDAQVFRNTLTQLVRLSQEHQGAKEVITHLAGEMHQQLLASENLHSNSEIRQELREAGYELLSLFSQGNVETSLLAMIAQQLPK